MVHCSHASFTRIESADVPLAASRSSLSCWIFDIRIEFDGNYFFAKQVGEQQGAVDQFDWLSRHIFQDVSERVPILVALLSLLKPILPANEFEGRVRLWRWCGSRGALFGRPVEFQGGFKTRCQTAPKSWTGSLTFEAIESGLHFSVLAEGQSATQRCR